MQRQGQDLTLCRFCNAKVPKGSVMCDRCTEYAKGYLEEYRESCGIAYLIHQHHRWARRYRAALEERGSYEEANG